MRSESDTYVILLKMAKWNNHLRVARSARQVECRNVQSRLDVPPVVCIDVVSGYDEAMYSTSIFDI